MLNCVKLRSSFSGSDSNRLSGDTSIQSNAARTSLAIAESAAPFDSETHPRQIWNVSRPNTFVAYRSAFHSKINHPSWPLATLVAHSSWPRWLDGSRSLGLADIWLMLESNPFMHQLKQKLLRQFCDRSMFPVFLRAHSVVSFSRATPALRSLSPAASCCQALGTCTWSEVGCGR